MNILQCVNVYFKGKDYGVKHHCQRYSSYIVAVSFIGGGKNGVL